MTTDGWAEAARILDTAIREANNAINAGDNCDPDVVTGWVCVLGCTTADDTAGMAILHPGMGDDEPGQAPWITSGLLHEAIARGQARQHIHAVQQGDDE